MENAQHDLMRRQMIAEVVADAVFLTAQLGKSAFAARVIEVMGKIPRHEFVPLELRPYAYLNSPLPVGYGKTISQPFIIALMTDLLQPDPGDVALEVGAGVGYQAAILSELVKRVYSIEIIEELALDTRRRLGRLGYRNIEVGVGNGYYAQARRQDGDPDRNPRQAATGAAGEDRKRQARHAGGAARAFFRARGGRRLRRRRLKADSRAWLLVSTSCAAQARCRRSRRTRRAS